MGKSSTNLREIIFVTSTARKLSSCLSSVNFLNAKISFSISGPTIRLYRSGTRKWEKGVPEQYERS